MTFEGMVRALHPLDQMPDLTFVPDSDAYSIDMGKSGDRVDTEDTTLVKETHVEARLDCEVSS